MTRNVRDQAAWLAGRLDGMDRKIAGLRSQGDLAFSSIEDGAIQEKDIDGNLVASVGKQHDGSHVQVPFTGPVPAAPVAPVLTAVPGMVEVRWSGKFVDGAVSAMDFKHVAVHVSTTSAVDTTPNTQVATIRGEMGDVATVTAVPGFLYVALVAWSTAGKASVASLPAVVLVPEPVDGDAIGERLDELDEKYGGVITDAGRLGQRLTDAETYLTAAVGRLAEAESDLSDAFGQISTVDGKASEAQQAAGSAQSAADYALTMAGSATKVYYSTAIPSGVARTDRDIWRQINATKDVVAEWFWDGVPPAGGWVKTLVSSSAISNLDVGKLTVGTGIITDLVAEHIAGRSARFMQLDVSQLVAVTGTMSEAVITKLWTDVVMSRKVTTQMMAVGDFTNLATDMLDESSWTLIGTAGFENRAQSNTGRAIRMTPKANAGGDSGEARSLPFPVEAGDNLYLTTKYGRIGGSRDLGGRFYFGVIRYDAAKNIIGYGPYISGMPIESSAGWGAKLSGSVVIPAGTAYAAVRILQQGSPVTPQPDAHTTVYDTQLRRMNGGELTVDGTVTARHADLESFAADTGFITDLTARIVQSDVFVGKEFIGGTFTGGVFRSPGGGAGFELSDNGYTSRDSTGNVTVRLPADGSPAQFKGDIEAQSLTASGRVSLQSPTNEIAAGATLVVESGVTVPATPPSVGAVYENLILPYTGQLDGIKTAGLARANNLWWRTSRGADYLLVHGINDAGTIILTITTGLISSNGVTSIGNELFILGQWAGAAEPRHVAVYNATTGAYLRRWVYTDYGSGTYQPCIGSDGTNLLIAQSWASGLLSWRRYNKTSGAYMASVHTTHVMKSNVVGIYQGAADFGQTRVVVSKSNGTSEAFTTDGAHYPAGSWYSANSAPVFGLVWEAGRFWHLTEYGAVGYSTIATPAGPTGGDTNDWWISQTWTGANGAETTAGPARQFTFLRRSALRLTTGKAPAGVTGARFYLARKTTTPTRADLHLIATVAGTSWEVTVLPANWATLPTPPSTNTFPNSSPGIIKSSLGNFEVRGDGSGKWGPLTFNPDGTMSSNAVPAWVPITAFLNGYSVGDFGFVPSYRAWPDGKVELRGIVKGTFDVWKTVFQLPPAVRLPHPVELVVATSTGGGGTTPAVMRAEIGGPATPDALSTFPEGKTRQWISLDGLYYYQV